MDVVSKARPAKGFLEVYSDKNNRLMHLVYVFCQATPPHRLSRYRKLQAELLKLIFVAIFALFERQLHQRASETMRYSPVREKELLGLPGASQISWPTESCP